MLAITRSNLHAFMKIDFTLNIVNEMYIFISNVTDKPNVVTLNLFQISECLQNFVNNIIMFLT